MIYLAVDDFDEVLKIGFSKNPKKRRGSLAMSATECLGIEFLKSSWRILYTRPGNRVLEDRIQGRFAHLRISPTSWEWFYFSEDIVNYFMHHK